jgi:hypothetical protein
MRTTEQSMLLEQLPGSGPPQVEKPDWLENKTYCSPTDHISECVNTK